MTIARALLLAGILSGCSLSSPDGERDGAPIGPVDLSNVHDAVPQVEPRSRYGNPPSYEVFGKTYHVMDSATGYRERGIASWYGTKFHGRRTSSGEPYDLLKMTAAHKSLPLPTYVQVRNLENGKQIIVKVNDRGPFHEGRIIDLSYAAAHKLGMAGHGTAPVEVVAIDPLSWPERTRKPSDDIQSASADPAKANHQPRLFVQAGAFGTSGNAERLRQQLASRFQQPAIVRKSSSAAGGKTLYRVQLGPLHDARRANRLAERLREQRFDGAHVVSY